MPRPGGADLFVCRVLTARSFGQRGIKVRFFLWREHIRRLGNARRGRPKSLFHGSLSVSTAHARSYLAFQRLDLGDDGCKQGRKMYRHGFPDIGRSDVVVLMPVEIANIADGSPRQLRMSIAQIVGQPTAGFRDDFQRPRHSIEMQTRLAETFAGHPFDKFAGKQDVVPNISYKASLTDSECINGFALGDRLHMRLERYPV